MFCKSCGKELPNDAKFCLNCGEATVSIMNSVDKSMPNCPQCHSYNITINKRGFSLVRGIVLGLFTGGIGLLAGFFGMNKLVGKCLDCGYKWDILNN